MDHYWQLVICIFAWSGVRCKCLDPADNVGPEVDRWVWPWDREVVRPENDSKIPRCRCWVQDRYRSWCTSSYRVRCCGTNRRSFRAGMMVPGLRKWHASCGKGYPFRDHRSTPPLCRQTHANWCPCPVKWKECVRSWRSGDVVESPTCGTRACVRPGTPRTERFGPVPLEIKWSHEHTEVISQEAQQSTRYPLNILEISCIQEMTYWWPVSMSYRML